MALVEPGTSAAYETAAGTGRKSSTSSTQELEALFQLHYTALCRYSLRYVKQPELAEEIVQDVFVSFWEKSSPLLDPAASKAYLYTAVRNRSLNYLNSQHARQQFRNEEVILGQMLTDNTREQLAFEELSILVEAGIKLLPPQCRTIFEMSRLGGFSYLEIAKELQLSPKTVENQMGHALRKLKEHLRNHWDLLQLLFITLSVQEWILFHI